MVVHYTLHVFETKLQPEKSQLVILWTGSANYYEIIRAAFRNCSFSTIWRDQYGQHNWGTFVRGVTTETSDRINEFLNLLKTTVCIEDALAQSFALSYHMNPNYDGGGRTKIGDDLYQAKYRHNQVAADRLVDRMLAFITNHPSFSGTDFIVAVPASQHNMKFNLPAYLTQSICRQLNIEDGSQYIRKVKQTLPMKDMNTTEDKFENIHNAFKLTGDHPFIGKQILIIDDLYQSGTTMTEIASVLQRCSARVYGLVATKTIKP